MKLATIVVATAASMASVASAWNLRLYDGPNYTSTVLINVGTGLPTGCYNLPFSADNKAESFRWTGTVGANRVSFYGGANCGSGSFISTFTGTASVPVFLPQHNNAISSYRVDAF